MKKYLLLVFIAVTINSVYATDYVVEAVKAFHSCQNSGTRCEDVKKYTESGIKAYSSTKNTSITNLKSYCSLVYLRIMHQSWGNQEQWMRDAMELNGSCKVVGALGL